MVKLKAMRFRVVFVALLALGLANSWLALGVMLSHSESRLPKSGKSWLFDGATIVSDFDGDNLPDRATGTVVGNNYKIEFQLSSREEKTSFSFQSNEPGISFVALDIDKDNDTDLVITSAFSKRPLAIWLNDSHGTFEKDNSWVLPDFLANDRSPSCGQSGSRLEPVLFNQINRLPSSGSVSKFTLAGLEAKSSSFISRPQDPFSRFPAYKLTSRAPPFGTIL